MGDVRDPERDQPLPVPGKIPVQEVMIGAIRERREHGKRKYGRALETHNGRDALKDAWEEAIDLFTYLTQMRLERGDQIEGAEYVTGMRGFRADFYIEDEAVDGIRPHRPMTEEESAQRKSLAEALGPVSAGALEGLIPAICPSCRHEPHTPGHCRSKALNLGCGCLCE